MLSEFLPLLVLVGQGFLALVLLAPGIGQGRNSKVAKWCTRLQAEVFKPKGTIEGHTKGLFLVCQNIINRGQLYDAKGKREIFRRGLLEAHGIPMAHHLARML